LVAENGASIAAKAARRHARSTTADDRQVRRRGALFSGEGDAAGVDGSRAPTHTPSDAPQPNGRAGGAPGQGTALVSDVDAAASEAILSGGGPTGAQSDVTAGESPAAVCKSGLEWAPYALVRAAASRRAANASQSRAVAQVACGTGAVATLAQALASLGQLDSAQAALGALADLQEGLREMAFSCQASDAAVNEYQQFGVDLMQSMLQPIQAGVLPPQASVSDGVAGMPEWLSQAALVQAADADADAAYAASAQHTDVADAAHSGGARAATSGGRHARRHRYRATVQLQAGMRGMFARRRAASQRRAAARPMPMTAAAHSCVVAQQIGFRSAAEAKTAAEAARAAAAAAAARATATARAAEAGHQARVAQATEPPIATDAPT
jgi:hypothetical protein